MTSPSLDLHPVYRHRLSNEPDPYLGGPLTYGFSRSNVPMSGSLIRQLYDTPPPP